MTEFREGDRVHDRDYAWKGGTVAQVLDGELLVAFRRKDRRTGVFGFRYRLVSADRAEKERSRTGPRLSAVECERLWTRAYAAGIAAGEARTPTPMVVGTPRDMMASLRGEDYGGFDPNEPVYRIDSGTCGFGWVTVHPANSSFARWMKANVRGSGTAYGGGVDYWVHEFGQSLERKEAFAHAMAAVLREAGIEAYGHSRMD